MKKYLVVLCLLLVGLLLAIVGLSLIGTESVTEQDYGIRAVTGSEAWCDAMLEKPNADWTEDDFQIFSRDCLYDQ